MIRKAFKMSVRKDKYAEYKKRHDEIFPEMLSVLKSHGASNYSIFLDENTGHLFAYVEIRNEKEWDDISKTEVCKKWWVYMKDIMPSNADNSPISVELKEIFYMK